MKKPPGGLFKPNDLVSFGGVKGVVATTSAAHDKYTMQVMFPSHKLVVGFLPDGRFLDWHSESSLTFIRRPSKESKIWATVKNGLSQLLKTTKSQKEKQP